MALTLRPHQAPLYEELNTLLNSENVVCLAADTGSGKTEIACKYILDNPNKRVVVFAHNQKILKQNFSERLAKYNIKHTTNVQDYVSGAATVLVALPAGVSRHLASIPLADTIIIDEAHEYYKDSKKKSKKLYTAILDWHEGQTILLTASHFEIQVPKVFFSREESLKVGQVADIKINLVSNELIELKSTDFNSAGDVKESFKFDFTDRPLEIILPHIKRDEFGNVIPTLVIAPTSDIAIDILEGLNRLGYNTGIDLSKVGYDRSGLDLIKSGVVDICVVKNKGILGFDYADLGIVIDCSFTQNVQRMIQSKRSGRVSEKGYQKEYIKLAPDSQFEHYKLLTTASVAAGQFDIYRSWDGQSKTVRIPVGASEGKIIVAGTKYDMVIEDNTVSLQKDDEEIYSIPFAGTEEPTRTEIIEHLVDSGQITKTKSGTKRVDPYGKPQAVSQEFELTFGKYMGMLDTHEQVTLREGMNFINAMEGGRTAWTYKTVLESAKGCKSIRKWQEKNSASYQWAYRNNLQNKIAKELGMVSRITDWTHETALESAKGYKNKGEWQKKNSASYHWALKNNLQNKIAKELGMVGINLDWTYETALEAAKGCKNKREWEKKNRASYAWALRNNLQDKIAKELGMVSLRRNKYSHNLKFSV